MDIFHDLPGMPGVFLAALFSASLRFVQLLSCNSNKYHPDDWLMLYMHFRIHEKNPASNANIRNFVSYQDIGGYKTRRNENFSSQSWNVLRFFFFGGMQNQIYQNDK